MRILGHGTSWHVYFLPGRVKKVTEKFPELDLGFLLGESSDDEAEPSAAGADLSSANPVAATSEPIEDAPSSSTAPPLEVGDLC